MLISAIMPTRGRPEFAARAVACYLAQTYSERELVIVDDSDAPSFPVPPEIEGVHYHRLSRRLSVGAKRNLACARSNGEAICHWDDDDTSAPGRIQDQVDRMAAERAHITGYCSMLFRDEAGRTWKYTGNPHYALGTSLMYAREFWRSHPFPDMNVGEDNAIVTQAMRIVSVDAGEMMTATIHAGNTSNKRRRLDAACWSEVAA